MKFERFFYVSLQSSVVITVNKEMEMKLKLILIFSRFTANIDVQLLHPPCLK